MNNIKKNIKVKATTPCYVDGMTLTPYVADDGEVWLASEGNGCGNDVMLEDISGWTVDEINGKWSDIDLDALRAGADEIGAVDEDAADYIRAWASNCDRARAAAAMKLSKVRSNMTYIARDEITGRERKFKSLDAAKAYFNGAKFRGAEFDRIEFSDETAGDGSRYVAVCGFFDQPDFKNWNRQIGIIDIDDGADAQ